jgi:hypothetical protein
VCKREWLIKIILDAGCHLKKVLAEVYRHTCISFGESACKE